VLLIMVLLGGSTHGYFGGLSLFAGSYKLHMLGEGFVSFDYGVL
jgi:hypothetical protein